VLLRSAILMDQEAFRQDAAFVLRRLGSALEKQPYGFARMLGALDFYLSTPQEIAVVGALSDERTRALLRVVHGVYLPNKVLAIANGEAAIGTCVALLNQKMQRDDLPTVYVCENFACQEPVTSPDALRAQLAG
jgi:uncharacterized protein